MSPPTRQRRGHDSPARSGKTSSWSVYSPGVSREDLDRRRAVRQARNDLAVIRALLDAFDHGDIDLDEVAFSIGFVGCRLGARAARGDLAA